MIRFHPESKRLLTWSATVWVGYALMAINAFDAGFYFFIGYAPLPQWAIGVISAVAGALIPVLRTIIQKKVSGDQHAGR